MYLLRKKYNTHMTEIELLHYSLREARKLSSLLEKAYNVHNHESDLHGGISLSAAKLSAAALEQELTALLMSIQN